MVIGGDINVTLGAHEIWGPKSRVDPLTIFFSNLLQNIKMVDLDPQKLKPTWTNRRHGEDRIEKILDKFLMEESLLGRDLMFKQWVDSGVDSYHFPICLEILRNPKKLAIPFKFCVSWLKYEEILRLIQSNWIMYVADEGTRAATHFTQNMSCIKRLLKEWARNKRILDDQAISHIEAELVEIHNSEGGGSHSKR